MTSPISSSSSLRPADLVSAVSESTPSSADAEIKTFGRETFVRVHLERPKKPRRGWWWEYGAEWEEISSDEPRFHWVCAVCVRWNAFIPAGSKHIQDHLAKIHQITDPANSTRRVVPISELVAQQKRDLTVTEKAETRSKRCRKALLDWFAYGRIAFAQVESKRFHAFCASLDEDYAKMIPSSHNLISRWLKAEFV